MAHMVSTAELFGGIGAMILTHRSEFEIACDDYGAALDAVSDKLNKLAGGDLRKSLGQSVQDILADVRRLQEIADRRTAALPSFEAFICNRPFPATRVTTGPVRDYGNVMLASKAIGTERGAELTKLPSHQQQTTIDPSKNVADASLARRFSK
jgi:hypothetical protein